MEARAVPFSIHKLYSGHEKSSKMKKTGLADQDKGTNVVPKGIKFLDQQ
jgi:hypothetical protein